MEYYLRGPEPAGSEVRDKLRHQAEALIGNFLDTESPDDRLWLQWHLLETCVAARFTLRQWWAEKPKRQLAALREKDPEMSRMVHVILTASSIDFIAEALQVLVAYVFDAQRSAAVSQAAPEDLQQRAPVDGGSERLQCFELPLACTALRGILTPKATPSVRVNDCRPTWPRSVDSG